jgi:hypothetical protein
MKFQQLTTLRLGSGQAKSQKARLWFLDFGTSFWYLAVSCWSFAKKTPWISEFFVFCVFLALYLPLQGGSSFVDPDAFYHLKIAELTAAHGPVRDFIWLPFTTLDTSYADHHFIYHLALVPFLKILGPLQGIKFATAVFAAATIGVFAWALRRLGVRYPLVWALVMGVMNPLTFRIGLAKASAPGVLLVILGLTLACLRKSWLLAIVAFVHVWTHGSWPATLALGTVAIFIMSFRAPPVAERCNLFRRLLRFARNDGGKSLFALWGGTIAGLIINPFFPTNLRFYWEQIVQIAIVNYQNAIGVGTEWYPYALHSLAADLPLLFIIAAAAIIVFPIAAGAQQDDAGRKRVRFTLALSAAALMFFVMTLRSRRHVEYFVPLAVAASAAWITAVDWRRLRTGFRRETATAGLLIIGIISMAVVYASASLARAKKDLAGPYQFTLYKQAAQYLIANTKPGEVVIHADWDDMPPLFYWDDHNRYMMGLDPTFLYSESRERYWDYVDFTLGKSSDPVSVMKKFGSRYVINDKRHDAMVRMLIKSGRFEKTYFDQESEIYRLK